MTQIRDAMELIYPGIDRASAELLIDSVDLFPLAPDEFVDVKRMPAKVVDMTSLVAYMTEIKTLMEEDKAEASKSGKTKLYKLVACCMHVIKNMIGQGLIMQEETLTVAETGMKLGRAEPPEGLSEKGKKLWEKTFEATNARTKTVMCMVLYFISGNSKIQSGDDDTNPNPDGPPQEAPGDDSGTAEASGTK